MGEQGMVERVARALAKADNRNAAWDLPPEFFMDQARAAIEAMRKPTVDMINAADRLLGSGFDDQYAAFIDAALKEQEEV